MKFSVFFFGFGFQVVQVIEKILRTSYSFYTAPFAPRPTKEDGVFEVFKKYGMQFPVELTYSRVGEIPEFPWIRPSAYLTALARTGELHRILGGYSLEESRLTLELFWERYRAQFPDHDIFKDEAKAAMLGRCIPLYCHGDEGTTYKKKGILIMGFQGVLGKGTRHAPNVRPRPGRVNDAGIPLNMLDSSLLTRLVSVICPKDTRLKPHATVRLTFLDVHT